MRLSRSVLVAYSLPAVPLAMLLTPIIIYLPAFYAGHLGISLSALGAIFFIGRLWDGITDPLIGRLSDRFQLRMGRRKPWVLLGSPFLVGATWLLCRPPEGVGTVYVLVALVLFYVTYTVVRIPYISWGAELSTSYKERNWIAGFRELGTMVGVFLSVGVPYFFLSPEEATMDNIMMIFTITVIVLMPLAAIFSGLAVPDRLSGQQASPSLIDDFRTLKRNRPYMRILAAQAILYLGTYIYNACLVFLVEHPLGLPGQFLPLILIEYIAMMIFVPALISISARIDKHRVIALGIVIQIVAFAVMAIAAPGSFWQAAVAFSLVGISFASWYIIPTSMIADAVDYGKMRGGADSAGIYMALFNFVDKAALAFAALIALPLLDLFNFDPQSRNVGLPLLSVEIVGLFLPMAIVLAAVLIYWNYPISGRKHATIIRYNLRSERRRPEARIVEEL